MNVKQKLITILYDLHVFYFVKKSFICKLRVLFLNAWKADVSMCPWFTRSHGIPHISKDPMWLPLLVVGRSSSSSHHCHSSWRCRHWAIISLTIGQLYNQYLVISPHLATINRNWTLNERKNIRTFLLKAIEEFQLNRVQATKWSIRILMYIYCLI